METSQSSRSQLTQERLRAVAWEAGSRFPVPPSSDFLALAMVRARQAVVLWQLKAASVDKINAHYQDRFHGSCLTVRVYDVTDVLFDGGNAHSFFDVDVHGLEGKQYISIHALDRNYIAEMGFRLSDGHFHPIMRSQPVYFGLDHPSGNYRVASLYVRSVRQKAIVIEDPHDAVFYERLHRALNHLKGDLSLSLIRADGLELQERPSALDTFLERFSDEVRELGFNANPFFYDGSPIGRMQQALGIDDIHWFTRKAFANLVFEYGRNPFTLVHCHDWCSSAIGLWASKLWKMPMVMTVHSRPESGPRENPSTALDRFITHTEQTAARRADRVIVPREEVRENLVKRYHVSEERVVVIPTPEPETAAPQGPSSSEVKQALGLAPDGILGLFAGEMSYASGADLLVNGLIEVCGGDSCLQFILIGDGPLKNGLQHRVNGAGLGARCVFWGDVGQDRFLKAFDAADFAAFTARQWRGDEFVRFAVENGKPVLTTHQAGVSCVSHGRTGLLAYDHHGSIVWGLREIISPAFAHMHARGGAAIRQRMISTRHSVIEHLIQYGNILEKHREAVHA